MLILSPLAFGTVEDWSFSLMAGMGFVVFALWLTRKIFFIPSAVVHKNYARQREKEKYFSDKLLYLRSKFLRLFGGMLTAGKGTGTSDDESEHTDSIFIFGRRFVYTGLEIPLIVILFLIGLQMTPLPPSFVKYTAPGSYSYYASYLPGYEKGKVDFSEYTSGLEKDIKKSEDKELKTTFSSWRTISLYPEKTFRSFLKYLVYLMVFVVCVNEFRDKTSRKVCFYTAVGMGAVVALVGILQYFYSSGYLLFLRPAPEGLSTGVPFGPFVNRNHFGGYLILVFPLAVALGLMLIRTKRTVENTSRSAENVSSRRKFLFASQTSDTEHYSRLFLAGYLVTVMFSALVISGSKAAIVLAGLSVVFLLYFSGEKKACLFLSVTLGLLGTVYMIIDVTMNLGVWQYIKTSSLNTRFIVWKGTWKMFCDFPFFGSGIGTFEEISGIYMDVGIPWRFREAHNDYLEVLSTGGILIAIPLVVLFLGFWSKALRRLKNRPDDYFATAPAAGLFVLCLHEFVDFNLQIGSNALLFTVLAALFLAHIQDKDYDD